MDIFEECPEVIKYKFISKTYKTFKFFCWVCDVTFDALILIIIIIIKGKNKKMVF